MKGVKNLNVPKLVELEIVGYKFTKREGSSVLHVTLPDGTHKDECMDGVPLTREYAGKFIAACTEDKHYANTFKADEQSKADKDAYK